MRVFKIVSNIKRINDTIKVLETTKNKISIKRNYENPYFKAKENYKSRIVHKNIIALE